MTRRPIGDPQPGERLLDVVPEPGPEARSGDHRLNLFSGRALSEVALQSQQNHWQNRLRQLAQLRSPGVVRGLEVSEEQQQTAEKWLHVNPGQGLSSDGEDVWLARPARISFSALPVLSGSPTTQVADPGTPDTRRLWILVLRPVSVLEADAADPNRCHEWDESSRAFEEETRRDGSLLGRFPLDLPLPMEEEGQFLTSLGGQAGEIFSISLSPDGKALASGGADGTVRLWAVESGSDAEPRAKLGGHEGGVNSVSWSPDGRRLASGGADGTIRLWTLDRESGAESPAELRGHENGVNSISWSPDGKRLASGGADGSVRLWSGESESGAKPLAVLEGHEGGVNSIGWSPDCSRLASGGADGSVRLWSGESGGGREPLAVLTGHEGGVSSLSWGPEGTVLASGGADGSVRLWSRDSASEAEPLALLKGGQGAVSCVGWSPDGKQLASGGADGTVQLWSGDGASSAEPLRVLGGHKGAVTSLGWSPDGQQVVSGGTDGLLLVASVTATEGRQRWRNLLAYALFGWEQRARQEGQTLPWESAGVPIALIALTADRQGIAFVDSAAVVRQGGRPREVMPLLPGSLPASLVRARLRQFAEQMAELPPIDARSAGGAGQWMREVVLPSFRHLPPFGLLPRAALGDLQLQALQPSQSRDDVRSALTTKDCLFFPQSWKVHLAPIPQEQLELALRDSTTLAPFDLEQPDQVQLWVPVPQSMYEPDLLLEEGVNPIFQQKIDAFTALRNDLLYRRGWLRRRLAAMTRAITGKDVEFATPDSGRLDAGEPEENESADAPDRDTDILRYVNRSTLLTAQVESATPDGARKYMLAVKFGIQRIQKGLLFYTPSRGEIDLCRVDESVGVVTLAKKLADWRQTWSVIVPGRFSNSTTEKDDLFFYDPSLGEAEIYSIREEDGLDRIKTLTGLSQTWQLIVPGNFGSNYRRTDLLFYDPSAGVLEFFAVETDRSLRSFKRLTGSRKSWTLIIPGNFGGGRGLTDLLFYDRTAGEGEFCRLDDNGDLTVIKRYTGWRKTWNFILPGGFSNGNFTDLFFHDPVNSEAEFYKISQGSQLSLLRKCWLPASPLSSFATGRFGVSPRGDGVFIDDSIVTPEGDYGTFYLISGLPRTVAPLYLLTALLLESAPIDTDSAVLLTKPIDPTKKEAGRKKLDDKTVGSIRAGLSGFSPLGKFTFTPGYEPGTGLLKINGVMTEKETGELKSKLTSEEYADYFVAAEVQTAIDDLYDRSKDNNSLLALDSRNSAFTGLEAFVQQLELKTAQTDDSIEFGFLQVRTNMYRIRQHVLGQEEVMKLATSPTLAAIASRESARASQDQLKSYFQRIKAERAVPKSDEMGPMADSTATDVNLGITALDDQPTGAEEDVRSRAFPTSSLLFQESNVSMASLSPTASFTRPIERDVTLFQTGGFQFLDPAGIAPSDVLEQAPLIGRVVETISVADRLDQPAAVKVSDFALNDQVSVLEGLSRQGLLKDLLVPGRPGETFGKLLPGEVVPPALPSNPTEADYFSNAVRTLDLTVASLRLGEGRVEQYRQAIARCKETLQEIRRQQGRLEARLRVVDAELAEARQDVSVAQSLLAEETARVNAINARRRRILKDQVPFLAFQRPRSLELRQTPPWIPLDPGPGADPLPPCLNDTTPIPREVRAMVELLREAPLGWFNALLPELRRMDRIDTLVRLFTSAAQRRGAIAPSTPPPLGSSEGSGSPIGRSINRLYGQRQQLLRQGWLRLPPEAQQAVAAQTWQESLRLAERSLTLGDLLAGDHHRPELSSQAAALLDQWCRVAACLKERFAAIAPQLRLDWAERLSQFDGPVNLRVLTNLPRWGEVRDPSQRRSLQGLVDWLFQQVNGTEEQATAFANDLVRLSLLLACHAPVNQIISGQVIGTPSLAPEARLPIRMDPLQVRIGMPVLFHGTGGVVAQGIVEDLSGTVATARILQGNANLSADAGTRVQFLRQSFL